MLIEIEDDQLDEYESKYIESLNTLEPNGYNVRTGGNVSKHSDESRERMRLSKIGELNHNYGKPRSDSTKNAISVAKSGEKHHFYGKTFSEEHKAKVALAHRKSHSELPMYMVYVKERPEHYVSSGYAIMNHPSLKNKYFTSKRLSEDEKFKSAIEYLNSMDAVQRLNGSG